MQEGDVVQVDYVLTVDGKAIETNIEDKAKELGFHEDGRTYQPLTVTLGARQVIAGLEEALLAEGDTGTFAVDIPAEKAYGARDPQKIKSVPMAEFRKQKVQPQVGMMVNFDNQRAIVQRVAGGRVRLDMNHELAGKQLRYDITVRAVIDSDEGKLKAVLESMFNGGAPFRFGDEGVEIELPDGVKFDREWSMHKFRLLTAVRQALGPEVAIRLVETYPGSAAEATGGTGGEEE